MKDWAVAFLAAASLFGLTLWLARIMVEVLYGRL